MRRTITPWLAAVTDRWNRHSPRDRRLLGGLGGFLLIVLAFSLIWQPARQRLQVAERQYQQQLAIAWDIQRAQPPDSRASARPQPAQLSERLIAAGLELQQFETADNSVRMTFSGDAQAILVWLDQTEQSGATLQSLTLEKRDKRLDARLVMEVSNDN